MPSQGVDLLWKEFIRNGEDYERFCQKAYGRKVRKKLGGAIAVRKPTDAKAMAMTFAPACQDEHLVRYQTKLPALFRVDNELEIPDGQRWNLNCGHSACDTVAGVRCIHHELLPLIPRSLPEQIRFGEPGPYPP